MSEGAAVGSKRSSEGGNSWSGGKKSRGDSVTLRFLLQSKSAGGIIGKGGETIKRLRSEFSATVNVPDTTTNERVLTIGAEKENCIKILKECLPLVQEPPYRVSTGGGQGRGEPKEPNPFEIDFLVHSSQVGGIIGRAGFKIKEIREETKANVKVYQECLPDSTERVVAIGGEEDQVVGALERMLEVMEEQPIKGNITLYDPSYYHTQSAGFVSFDNYNSNFNQPPGGIGGGMRGGNRMGGSGGGPRGGGGGGMRGGMGGGGMGGPGGRGLPGSNFGPGSQGGYGGGGMGQQDFGNNFGGDYQNTYGSQGPPQGDSGYGGGAGGNFNNGVGGNYGGGSGNTGDSPSSSTQVTIPNDMAGAIIGKGGERIRGIRQKCGADIKFSDSEAGKDRLITISGSQDQIQYAQYLMQQCVRENHR